MNRLPHYDWLGRCLAPAGDCVLSMPDEAMWPELLRLAGGQFVTPLLYCNLRDRGLLDQMPEEPRQYLADIYALNLTRNNAIRQQLVELATSFNQAGLLPLVMKGAATLLTDLYGDPGARVLGDIDLFLPQADLPEA
ncbi:MAG: nucleotidyltransferase family protein, partial [Nevskiales bacterium]